MADGTTNPFADWWKNTNLGGAIDWIGNTDWWKNLDGTGLGTTDVAGPGLPPAIIGGDLSTGAPGEAGNPSRGGFRQAPVAVAPSGRGDTNMTGSGGNAFFDMLRKASGPTSGSALSNLMEILQGKGRTSPDLLNRELTTISRDTDATQDALRGEMAGRGLSGSGVGMALGTAIGESGSSRRAGAIAEENKLAEQRMRDDIDLWIRGIVNPSIDDRAISAGQFNASAARSDSNNNALIAALGALIGS